MYVNNNGRGSRTHGTGFCGYNSTWHYAVAHGLHSGSVNTSAGTCSETSGVDVPNSSLDPAAVRAQLSPGAREIYDRIHADAPETAWIHEQIGALLGGQGEISREQLHAIVQGCPGTQEFKNQALDTVPVHHNGASLRDLVAADALELYDRVNFGTTEGKLLLPYLISVLSTHPQISRHSFVEAVFNSAARDSLRVRLGL